MNLVDRPDGICKVGFWVEVVKLDRFGATAGPSGVVMVVIGMKMEVGGTAMAPFVAVDRLLLLLRLHRIPGPSLDRIPIPIRIRICST